MTGISTSIFGARPLVPSDLDRALDAGFDHVELFARRTHLDYGSRTTRREFREWFRSHPSPAPALHLPDFRNADSGEPTRIWPLAPEARQREAARDEIKRALELTDHLGISRLIVHLGLPGQPFDPTLFDHAWRLLDMIRSFAGLPILVETLPGEASSPERILELLDLTAIPGTAICYDVGHEHLAGRMPTFERAGEVHLSDSDGASDQHLLPFEGEIDWPRLARALALARFSGPIVLEGEAPNPERGAEAAGRFESLVAEARRAPEDFGMSDQTEASRR
jgi:sugar phosphate isomerase/epimerase